LHVYIRTWRWPRACKLAAVAEFRVQTVIAAALEDCFNLSISVDAHTSSMAKSGERIVAGVTSGQMKLGDRVTWRARHFGVPFRMTSAITLYEFPSRFVDEQQQGPFASWWHEHAFSLADDGRTQMTDTIRFASPLGPVGSIADRLVLGSYMPKLIRHRNAWLKHTLEANR
jgi:ligand-binding SRPBCC domain-containing protein